MSPRALELFDLPKLHRLRDAVVILDSRRALTRGNPLQAGNFIAYLNPKRRIYTAIMAEGGGEFVGGIIQRKNEHFARFAYLAPHDAPLALIDHLCGHAGSWHARQVLAELDEDSPLFPSLRQAGFAVYSHQRIWNLSHIPLPAGAPPLWRKEKEIDLIAIQSLQQKIVPPLLQQVESFSQSSDGVLCAGENLLGYIEITYGARGIYLRPLIHPNMEDFSGKLLNLLANFPNRRGRSLYLCIRSHQAWLENTLDSLGAQVGGYQALLVKHLAAQQRVEKAIPAASDKAWANPAASISTSREEL